MYAKLDQEIQHQDTCRIGVGYTTCQDIGFKAVDLFKALEPELNQLSKITPQVHAKIDNFAQFVETFLWHFKEGVNGEYVSQNKELFFLLINRLETANIHQVSELGGHSSVWALRAQQENCHVYTSPN